MTTIKPMALVTGASGGIGEALAHALAADGYDLVLVARSGDALGRVADALRPAAAVDTIPLDLQGSGAGETLERALDGRRVDLLVNNAGYGVTGPFLEQPREAQLGEITLNVEALTDLTHRFVGRMRRERFGRGVINVASTAAFQPGPHMAVYYATKAYVLSFTEALAQELKGSGLTATALCPGPVATGFQARAQFDASMRLTRLMQPRSPAFVADAALRGFKAGRPVVIPGAMEAVMAKGAAFTPRPWLLAMVEQLQRKGPH